MATSGRALDPRLVRRIQTMSWRGLTVREIADKFGVSLPTVRKYGVSHDSRRLDRQSIETIREMARAGFTARDIARQIGVMEKTVRHHASDCLRARPTARSSTPSKRSLGKARLEGYRAALDRLPESSCPYGTGELGARCAWMAAYHDNRDLLA